MSLTVDTQISPLLSDSQVSIIFICFVAFVFLVSLIKKIYYRVRWHRRYYIIPRIRIRGITNVAMIISMSIAIILLLTFISSGLFGIFFRGYPGARVLIEGILIQLGGLLFGPFIGLLIGGITDLLTIALTAGMFHPGFFIIVLAYGIIAGLFKSITIIFKNNNIKYAILASLIYIVVTLLLILYIWYQQYPNFVVSILAKKFIFIKLSLIITLLTTLAFVILVVWSIMFIVATSNIKLSILKMKYNISWNYRNKFFLNQIRRNKSGTRVALKQASWYTERYFKVENTIKAISILEKEFQSKKSKNLWVTYFIQSIFIVFVNSAIINVFFAPCFDRSFSTFEFDHWLVIRTLSYPFIAILNFAIIFPSYKVINRLIKYNYNEDNVEVISKQYLD